MKSSIIALILIFLPPLLYGQTDCESKRKEVFNIYFGEGINTEKNTKLEAILVTIDTEDCIALRATILVMQGNIFKNTGSLDRVTSKYNKALEIREAIEDNRGVASIYNNRIDLSIKEKKYEAAIAYADSAMNILNKEIEKDTSLLGKIYINRATAFWLSNSLDSAKMNYNRASSFINEESRDYPILLQGLGDLAKKEKQYETALAYYEQASRIYIEIKNLDKLAMVNNTIGIIYINQKKHVQAVEKFEASLTTAKAADNLLLQRDALWNLVLLNIKLGNEEKVKTYKEELKKVNDDKAVILSIETYEKDIKLKESIIQGQRLKILLALFGLAILGLIFGVYWFRQQAKAKEQELNDFKAQEDVRYLTNRKKLVKKGIEDVSHEIHDEKTRITIVKRELEFALQEPTTENITSSIDNSIDLLDEIFYNLRTISQDLREKSIWRKQMLIDLEQLERAASIEVESKNFSIDDKISEEIGDEMSKIFSVLLDNIHQHAKATKVSVDLTRVENELVLVVEDNGKGFDQEKTTFNAGLQSVKQRVEQKLKGKLDIDAVIGRGSIFTATIPI